MPRQSEPWGQPAWQQQRKTWRRREVERVLLLLQGQWLLGEEDAECV